MDFKASRNFLFFILVLLLSACIADKSNVEDTPPKFQEIINIPFNFKMGLQDDQIPHEKITPSESHFRTRRTPLWKTFDPLEAYCPPQPSFGYSYVIDFEDAYDQKNYTGPSVKSLDFQVLSTQAGLNDFLEHLNFPYILRKHAGRFKNSLEYKKEVFVANAIVTSKEYKNAQEAFKNRTVHPSIKQYTYKVEGGLSCADFLNGELWRLTINAKAMSSNKNYGPSQLFKTILKKIEMKYGSYATHNYFKVNMCYKFNDISGDDQSCIIKKSELKDIEGITLTYLLELSNAHKPQSYENKKNKRWPDWQMNGYLQYTNEATYTDLRKIYSTEVDEFIRIYSPALGAVRKKALAQFDSMNSKDSYLDQF